MIVLSRFTLASHPNTGFAFCRRTDFTKLRLKASAWIDAGLLSTQQFDQTRAKSLRLDRRKPFVYASILPNSGKSLRLDRCRSFVYASILPNSGKSLRLDRCVAALNGRYPITKFS